MRDLLLPMLVGLVALAASVLGASQLHPPPSGEQLVHRPGSACIERWDGLAEHQPFQKCWPPSILVSISSAEQGGPLHK
jgi:hypothetical protein